MARFNLNTGTLCGRDITALAKDIIETAAQANRVLAIWNAIGVAGLEDPQGEAQFPVGSGATLMAGLQSVVTALNTLAATMSAVDKG